MPLPRQHNSLRVITEPRMPAFGVALALVDGDVSVEPGELFRFWLLSHADVNVIIGPAFWRVGVLRKCLPEPGSDLHFEAVSELLR